MVGGQYLDQLDYIAIGIPPIGGAMPLARRR
jgi:hypothetical protein